MSAPKKFSVLWYKRTNKVHKNRGTTREDGILTIAPPPSCLCTLVSGGDDGDGDGDGNRTDDAPNDNDSGDEEEDRKKTQKKKYQQLRKKMTAGKSKSGKIWSGTNADLSRRAFGVDVAGAGIGEDDALAFGQWECEIVAVLNADGGAVAATAAPKYRGGGGLKPKGMVKRGAGPTSLRKTPPPGGLVGSHRTEMPPRATLGTLRKNALKGPLRSKKVGPGGGGPGAQRTLGATAATLPSLPSTARGAAPPPAAGKLRKDAHGHWCLDAPSDDADDDDDGDGDDTPAPARAGRVPASLLRRTTAAKRPRLVASLRPDADADGAAPAAAGDADFPGAAGLAVPASVRAALRPHQQEGIAFLWRCVTGVQPGLREARRRSEGEEDGTAGAPRRPGDCPRGAVLADEMGLGKTLMTIATIFSYHRRHRDRRYIVVCPSSLVTNWAKEFDKWLGKASQPRRVVVRDSAEAGGLRLLRSFVPLKPRGSEVLILSYELFRMHVRVLHTAKKVGLLVVDEGHRLKNTSGSQILTALTSLEAEARILITGTPIQNNLSEFYNVANFAVPNILGDLSTFRRLYDRPMSVANQKNASAAQKRHGRQQSQALDAITSTFVLRRLQKDVLKSLLPPRMELLLFCKPSARQCALYRGIAARAAASSGGAEGGANPLMLLTEARKLCTHPSLLKDGDPDDRASAGDASLSGKMTVLASLLDSIRALNPTDKVVIISNFTSALTVIEESILRPKDLSFLRLDGSTDSKVRGTLVDSFNRGSVSHSFAFLLSSKAGGCGLNLIGANRLVMVDADWNPATDHQAMARVYRQGQTKPCFVYRLFTTGTVEEVIYQRQMQKGNLARMAKDGGNKQARGGGGASFSKEELRDCFTLKEGCTCDTQRKLGKKWSEYEGVASLTSQGCRDGPLLGVCGAEDATLTFVRVVEEEEEDIPRAATGKDEEASDDGMLSSERSFSGDSEEEEEESSEEEEFEE